MRVPLRGPRRAAASLAVMLIAVPAAAIPVERITDPRPGSATVDLTRTLARADVAAIDGLARRARGGGELVVVVVDSVGGSSPRAYATALFNRWKLDDRTRNRGVLLLVALSDRKVEIVLGDGYAASATRITGRVMRDVIVARFKAGRARDAIVEGARALTDELIVAPAASQVAGDPASVVAAAVESAPEYEPGFLMRLGLLAVEYPRSALSGLACALVASYVAPRLWRRRSRKCPDCGYRMVKLGERDDDAHLTSGEQAEERAGSADYDIWECPSCRRTIKSRYARRFSHRKCGQCGARTLEVTTSSLGGGWVEVRESCTHCSHTAKSMQRESEASGGHSSDSGSSGGGSSSGSGSSGSW